MTDKPGNTTSVSYDTAGDLETVTTANGRSLNFTVTGGLITQVATSDGRTVDYAYTSGGLTSVTDPTSR